MRRKAVEDIIKPMVGKLIVMIFLKDKISGFVFFREKTVEFLFCAE